MFWAWLVALGLSVALLGGIFLIARIMEKRGNLPGLHEEEAEEEPARTRKAA